jgi:hypothetical protein
LFIKIFVFYKVDIPHSGWVEYNSFMTDPNKRVIDPELKPGDRLDHALRPKKLVDMIGQSQIKENLQILI